MSGHLTLVENKLYYFELSTLLSLFMNNNLFSLLVKYFKFTSSIRFVIENECCFEVQHSCELIAFIIFIYYLSIINHLKESAFTRSY